jgi:Fe-S cluster assembly protein SufD
MSGESKSDAPYAKDYQAFAREVGRSAPNWLSYIRQCAFERFGALGFPTTKNEDWHFTSVGPIVEAAYPPRTAPGGDVKPEDLAPFTFGASDWPTIVFVNGVFSPALSSLDSLPDGVKVYDMATAMRRGDTLVERNLSKYAPYELNTFTALNTAFVNDGAVVVIAKEFEVDRPIHVLFVSDAEAAKTQSNPRTLIIAERHSRATVIESYVGTGEAGYFTNAVTEVLLEDGANLSHLKIQRESPRAFHVGTIEAEQKRDSHYQSFSFSTGAQLSRTNIYTTLDGEGAGATLNGLYMLDGEQHCDHQTRIEHAQPNCFSRELYKGVLDGASHGVFNGKVYVHPIAQKTDGKQTNNVLLLSERAQVDTKPQLEIFADDVKCTHGATVGRIDQTALFYMKSRGINRELARRLLTYAFAAEVLETIEVTEVREDLEKATLQRFTGIESVVRER